VSCSRQNHCSLLSDDISAGQSVESTPSLTFVPTKVLGLQNLVKYAIENKKRVRCAGYRHSWSPVFSDDNEILVSMIPLKQATDLPDPHVLLPNAAANLTNELKTIELVAEPEPGAATALVRIGAAVTTEEFRRWQVQSGKWALPMDVVLGESATPLHSISSPHQSNPPNPE
jgi:FAD/FMN-containing dehydrogenase